MLAYDPMTGRMTRNGVVIGNTHNESNKYHTIRHRGKVRKLHRVAFELMSVSIPPDKEVDHINRDTKDNRWCNLRLVTRSEQQCNKSLYNNNSTGVKGLRIRDSKYQVRKYVEGRAIYTTFLDYVEAVEYANT